MTRIAIAAFAAMTTLLGLTACGATEPAADGLVIDRPATDCGEPMPLAVVTSPHSNAPGLSLDAQMHCLVRATVEAGLPLVIVKIDGVPDLLINKVLPVDDTNDTLRADSLDTAVYTTMADALRDAAPDEDGADLVAGLDAAAQALRSHGVTSGRLLVTTPGLPDTGLLNMTQPGMLTADPHEVAQFTAEQSRLDLAPFEVILRGVGSTSAPQEPLAPVDRDKVVALLTELLETAGATVVVVPMPSTVTTVNTPFSVGTTEVPEREAPDLVQTSEPIVFDQSRIEFTPSSTRLADPAEAARFIRPVCEWLAEDPTRTATFTGTTATAGTPEGRRQLSRQRASAAARLCEVDPARIRIVGAGTDHPDHVQDIDASGRLIPHLAAQNRTVRVQPHN
ncbi:OmpA family protein [Ruania rhizosphaerae]|uniref:OmpA family protein n=1 Tax=Ruania rhizosphaerae TaxID=1840413 RepID=UPI00135CAAE2|nr:OmpA family protein [Ruania rhizosphaerae]